MKLLIKLFLFVALTTACNKKKETGFAQIIKLEPDKSIGVNRSDLFNIERIYPLQLQDSIKIGEIKDIIFLENYMAVCSDVIYLFDYDGKFINTIGQIGQGPGEFITMVGTSYKNDTIIILGRDLKKIIKYNLSGEFIEEGKIDTYGQSYMYFNNTHLVYSGNEINDLNKKIVIYNENLATVEGLLEQENDKTNFMNFMDKTNFYWLNDTLRFLSSFDNHVYNIVARDKKTIINKKYFIDFGSKSIPDEFFEQSFANVMEFSQKLQTTSYAYRIMGFYETDKHIMFMFWYGDSPLLAAYSKQHDKVAIVDSINDDLLFEGRKFSPIDEFFSYFFFKDSIYYVLDAYILHTHIKQLRSELSPEDWELFTQRHIELLDYYNNSTANSPPLMIKLSLNNDLISAL